jgi:hypothetical protein
MPRSGRKVMVDERDYQCLGKIEGLALDLLTSMKGRRWPRGVKAVADDLWANCIDNLSNRMLFRSKLSGPKDPVFAKLITVLAVAGQLALDVDRTVLTVEQLDKVMNDATTLLLIHTGVIISDREITAEDVDQLDQLVRRMEQHLGHLRPLSA